MLSCLSRESLILCSAKHPLVSFATDLAAAFAALTWNLKMGGMQNRTVPDCAMPLSSLARLCGYLMPETCHGAHGTKDFKLCVSTKTLQSFGGNIDDHFALHWPKSLGFSHNQTFEFDVGPSSSCSWGCSGLCCQWIQARNLILFGQQMLISWRAVSFFGAPELILLQSEMSSSVSSL